MLLATKDISGQGVGQVWQEAEAEEAAARRAAGHQGHQRRHRARLGLRGAPPGLHCGQPLAQKLKVRYFYTFIK